MNLEEVAWALCTRVDPATDIEILKNTQGSKVDPMRRKPGPTYNSRVLIDACNPFEWMDEFPEVAESSPEYIEAVRKKSGNFFEELKQERLNPHGATTSSVKDARPGSHYPLAHSPINPILIASRL